jgi:hypothetical protein
MPSWHDVAHGGVLCTFSNRSAQERGECMVWSVRACRRYGPSITYKIALCLLVTLLQPARRAAVLGQPSSLRLIDEAADQEMDQAAGQKKDQKAGQREIDQLDTGKETTRNWPRDESVSWPENG